MGAPTTNPFHRTLFPGRRGRLTSTTRPTLGKQVLLTHRALFVTRAK